MNVNIIDNVGITYLLADAIADSSVYDFNANPAFDARSIVDKVNENATADLFEGFKTIEFYRICAEVFRKRAVTMRKPLVVIFRQAAVIVHEMYKKELAKDG